eukprot:3835063-Amphidinium_carterae.4
MHDQTTDSDATKHSTGKHRFVFFDHIKKVEWCDGCGDVGRANATSFGYGAAGEDGGGGVEVVNVGVVFLECHGGGIVVNMEGAVWSFA